MQFGSPKFLLCLRLAVAIIFSKCVQAGLLQVMSFVLTELATISAEPVAQMEQKIQQALQTLWPCCSSTVPVYALVR